MNVENAIVFGRGFILSGDEFNHLGSHFDGPELQEKWDDFYDRYIRPIDSYSCTDYFIGVMDDLGIEAGSYAPYPVEPSFSKSEIDDFIHDMIHLRINKLIGKKTIKTYILHLLY
jgi:hypothetical protein